MASNKVKNTAAASTGKTAASKSKESAAGSKKTSSKSKSSASGSRKTAGSNTAKGKTASRKTTGGRERAAVKSVSSAGRQTEPETYGQERANPMILREAALWLVLAVCILIFISFLGIGGYLGEVISDVCFGVFGVAAYLFPFLLFIASAFLISNKGNRMAAMKFGSSLGLYLCVCSFASLFTKETEELYEIAALYDFSAAHRSGGGVVGGAVCGLLRPALGSAGTGVVLLILSIVFLLLITQKSLIGGVKKQSSRVYHSAVESSARRKEAHRKQQDPESNWRMDGGEEVPFSDPGLENRMEDVLPDIHFTESASGARYVKEPVRGRTEVQSSERPARTEIEVPVLFPVHSRESRSERRVTGVTMNTKIQGSSDRIGAEIHEIMPKKAGSAPDKTEEEKGTSYIDLDQMKSPGEEPQEETAFSQPDLHIEGMVEIGPAGEAEIPEKDNIPEDSRFFESFAKEEESAQKAEEAKTKIAEEFPKPEENTEGEAPMEEIREEQDASGAGRQGGGSAQPIKKNPRSSQKEIEEGIASVEAEMAKAAEAVKPEYVYPPLRLLKKGKGRSGSSQEQEIRKTAAKLQQTLDSFGVHVTVTNVSCGPSVTRYELLPEQGVKVSRIVGLSDDIKLNLAASDIRIEAPIPGKSAVGIEVPNSENSTVALRDLLESDEFQKHPSKLAFATGKDIGGKVVVSDIAKMPHLLIAGATGSGKSVCINTLIMSILYKASPEEVKLIMIDPKVVELSVYNGIPHLFIPVVTDPKKAAGALNWGVAEMTDRYQKFAEFGVRDLKGYNKKIDALKDVEDENKPKKLPQIVIIVDELADLMMVAPGEVEDSICRLAQLARAAGIHLIIATQRPSVNVITGLIKANMPSRIAFSVTSNVDSRTIIDMAGAEKLLGKGDMLFYPQGYQKPARVQGAFVSDEEVSDVVDFLKNKNTDPSYSAEIEEQIAKVQHAVSAARNEEDTDALFADAGKFIIEKDKASIGMLQRVFKIGFNRAARIMDQLSEAGVVGPEEGTKPRKILMSVEEFENYLEQN